MLASARSRISSSFLINGIGELGLGYRIHPRSGVAAERGVVFVVPPDRGAA